MKNGKNYMRVHRWLYVNFGRPESCEECGKNGRKINGRWIIEWAKRKGCRYLKKRENFRRLCVQCHKRYDLAGRKRPRWIRLYLSKVLKGRKFSKATKMKMSASGKKKRLSEEHKKKISLSLIGNDRAKGKHWTLKK